MSDSIHEALSTIVGSEHVSKEPEELFLYARDPGTMQPREPDFVALPGSTEEVRQILLLANQRRIPVVPLGGGLVLSGLTIPQKGGIVLDMKRMDRILEVNESSRYVIVEAGVSQGALQAYLRKNYPQLKHSIPDSPPTATVAGNILIHGSGHLSQATGFHSDMLNGLEVVLPTGEVCQLGSCSVSPYWFARAPLPDLSGLFLGWFGTTGVVTKLAIKLYPNPALRDVMLFVTESEDYLPDILYRLTGTEMLEDLLVTMTSEPRWVEGMQMTRIHMAANSDEELELKRRVIKRSLRSYVEEKEGGFMDVLPPMKGSFLETPIRDISVFADSMKGGGFEYVGAIMPIEQFPKACREGASIAKRNRMPYVQIARIVGRAHSMMFAWGYPFNRADKRSLERAQQALDEANRAALDMGGIPWKAERPSQELILERMDPATRLLMQRVQRLMDPNGIMNPGNWQGDGDGI